MGDLNKRSTSENCTQEDILWVASVVSSATNDRDLTDLAACLEVSLDGTDETGDPIVKCLSLWRSKNGVDCSRGKLLQCLQQLKNATSFIDKLLARYSTESPVEESSNSPGICIDFPHPHMPSDDSITQTPQLSNEIEPDKAFPLAVPAKEVTGKTSKMLVCGQRTDILSFRNKPELFTKLEVTQKISEKEEVFSDIIYAVQMHFQSCSEDIVQAIKSSLISLSMSIREDISPCVFTSHQAEIITYNKVPQIFQWLTINGFWSFLNFYLLEKLVDRHSGSDDLKKRVADFKAEMEKFKQEMKLSEFLSAWSGRCPLVSASGFEPVILRVNKDWPNCTLADVAQLEGYLESRFLINRFILRFANSHPGSVVIMWLVPSHAIAFLKKRIMAVGTESLSEVGIVEMKFGDNFTVKASLVRIHEPELCTAIKSKSFVSDQDHSKTLLDCGKFDELYATSVRDPEFFWGTLAKQFLQWDKPFVKVMDCNMEEGEIKWFTQGKLNVSVICVDRHAKEHPDRVALIWEKDIPEEAERVTYRELLEKVCQIANVLKSKGVKKGDTVAIYMPTCPLTVASMLACARIGAVHSVLFSKFTLVQEAERKAQLLKERVAGAKVIITANTSPLSGKALELKKSLEVILESSDIDVQHVLVYKRTDAEVPMKPGRDEWLEEAMERQPKECEPESMDSEDDLFVMFTSGVIGSPKGIIHSQAGYLLHVAVTQRYYFDYQPGEIFACTADIGWITGHSYTVYGPLCNGATTVLFDSTAIYPNPSRYWEVVQRLKINHFYTTPSVIRKLMSFDKDIPSSFDLSSLKVIASVGECLNKEAWKWFHRRFGNCRCHFIDTWWQTELGGIAIAPHPKLSLQELKPGFIMKPSFGVIPHLIDKDVEQIGNEVTGKLYLEAPVPGMGRRLTGDEGLEMFKKEYFKNKHGKALYYTSDIAHRDKDGDYQIFSKAKDAIRYHGELLNLPIIEGAANASHESIEETVLVLPLDHKDSAVAVEEPNVVAHVQLKDELTPKTEQVVIFNIQKAIEQTAPIKREKVQVKVYQQDRLRTDSETFSGKIKRQTLRSEYPSIESQLPEVQRYKVPTEPPWRQNNVECVISVQ